MTMINISGSVYDVVGAAQDGVVLTITPVLGGWSNGAALILGESFKVTADGAGAVDFDVEPGAYRVSFQLSRGVVTLGMVVGSDGPYDLAEVIAETTSQALSTILAQAQAAAASAAADADATAADRVQTGLDVLAAQAAAAAAAMHAATVAPELDTLRRDIPILVAAQPLAWYDPSDLSTLYQDSAMTIPVTADGDRVGAMLDKSGHGLHMLQVGESTTRPVYRTAGGLSWLEFDGVDDAMAVASFSIADSDEITFAAAVHTRRNDLAGGILCELSAISSSTPGTFSLVDPELGTARTLWRSRGNLNVTVVSAWPADPPPASVLVGLGKISTDLAQLRRNGGVVATSANDQGSGGFATAPLYLGARAATTFLWSGALYGMLISGSIRSATDIATIEAYLASKSGVTL